MRGTVFETAIYVVLVLLMVYSPEMRESASAADSVFVLMSMHIAESNLTYVGRHSCCLTDQLKDRRMPKFITLNTAACLLSYYPVELSPAPRYGFREPRAAGKASR